MNASAKNEGDGTTPEKAFKKLADALRKAMTGGCIYMLPGIYQEDINIENTGKEKEVTIRNYGKGKVVIKDSKIILGASENLSFDGIIFQNSEIALQKCSAMTFIRCVFDGPESGVKANNSGTLSIVNNTFLNGSRGITIEDTDVIFRNNLCIGGGSLPLTGICKKVISENNAIPAALLAEWKKKYPETISSFSTDAKISAENDYALPKDSALTFAGLGWMPVGAKTSPVEKKRPIIVENLKAVTILPDSVVIQWETPFHYPDVIMVCKDVNGKKVFSTECKQGKRMQTVNAVCIRKLQPSSKYTVSLSFQTLDGERLEKSLVLMTSEGKKFTPETLFVSALSGNDNNTGKSSDAPKKSIMAALNAAGPGASIIVKPGVYTEEINIFLNGISKDKPLTLKSEAPGRAIINGDYVFDSAIKISDGREIIIDGFKFDGFRYSASTTTISLNNCEDIAIRNCIFNKNQKGVHNKTTNQQIEGSNLKNIEISNCIFDSGFSAILFHHSNKLKVFNCTFHHTGCGAVFLGCREDGEAEIYNNIFENVVANHTSAAVAVGTHTDKTFCDYNLYWKTDKIAPAQKFYAANDPGDYWSRYCWQSVKTPNYTNTLEETRQKYNVEKHGQFADPLFKGPEIGDFNVKEGSPAIGKGRNGSNIGADMNVFSK